MGEPGGSRQVLGGRYVLCGEIAAGGMATVYSGRMIGPAGFTRTVAIKRLHAQYARDPEFVTMFVDEIRMTSHISHPNVVPTIDVVADGGELSLVMEYVAGESLARLRQMAYKRGWRVPPHISTAIMAGALYGLHAAHEAKDDRGEDLGLVHRDVSPQNILIGVDGSVKMVDFGVAKAAGRMQMTRAGQLKGKVAYMSPEQVSGQFPVSRQSDVYA